ncbi:504_t:CDS:2, partial [Gigaspora rosea]
MNELSLPTDNTVNSKIVWRPLFSNLRCIQVPLTEVPSVIDLYTFDTVLSGGGSLSEGNIKSITLIDKDTKYLSNSTLAYVEYLKCSARKKAISNAKVIRKEIASRSTNTTLSILATKFMNNAKISNVTASTPANQVQLISSRFTPNLEAIQNALKYDKKLYYPSALEFEKHTAAELDDDDVQYAAAELDDDDDVQNAKKHVCILPGSNYFETCLKQWKEPYIVSCGSEFKTKNGEKPKNIPMNAFRFDKYTSVETGKTKATSTRQIDQQLPLILAINVTGISINEEGICFENKDLLEEISFPPDDEQKKQRYHLTGVSFCNSNHHVADIHFENIKNSGWYQYDGIGKTYRARAMHIGNARPPHRDGYVMNFNGP